jgi:hypothetical protein
MVMVFTTLVYFVAEENTYKVLGGFLDIFHKLSICINYDTFFRNP